MKFIFLFFILTSCAYIRIDNIVKPNLVHKQMDHQSIDDLQIAIQNGTGEVFWEATKKAETIRSDINKMRDILIKKGIRKITVIIDLAEDKKEANYSCGSECRLLWPSVSNANVKVQWNVEGNHIEEKYVKKVNYTLYAHILLFPYGIYNIIKRAFQNDLEDSIFVPSDRESAAVLLNKQIIQDYMANKINNE